MYRVTLVDAFCPRPYDDQSLTRDAIGGTESAVILLSEALARTFDCRVEVLQHCRKEETCSAHGVRYRPARCWKACARRSSADQVIIINSHKLLKLWHRHSRVSSQLFLWRHNFLGNHYRSLGTVLEHCDAKMVCVSETHTRHSLTRMAKWPAYSSAKRLTTVPNPVLVHRKSSDRLASSYDHNKVMFCSSPHKGLQHALSLFAKVYEAIPSIRLYVCNPGYLEDALVKQPGVNVLGALDRPTLHKHIAESLCVFYPQTEFAETFGLVAAEANALGTPVLAPANVGALRETLTNQDQLLDNISAENVVNTITRWRTFGRPGVTGNPNFNPNRIADRWRKLFEQSTVNPRPADVHSPRANLERVAV